MMSLSLIKNAGVISKPSDYELTWTAFLNDKRKIHMFGDMEDYDSKVDFKYIRDQKKNLDHVLWIGTEDKSIHFGVYNSQQMYFMINGKIYAPMSGKYYNATDFTPLLFIRNFITLETNISRSVIKDKSIEYFAGFTFKDKNTTKEMYISWDGKDIKKHGFNSYECIGEYTLDE